MDETMYDNGLDMVRKVDGQAGVDVVERMESLSPDLARYVVEFAFGEVMSRPGLDLRSREIATVAALAAMGTARPQLMVHVEAALHVGVTREEIMEIAIQMAVYAGFPAALNAAVAAAEVFARLDEEPG